MKRHLVFSSLLCLLLLSACTQKSYYAESGTVFNTLYKLKYEAEAPLTEKIDAELQKFSLSLNPFNPNSIIAQVNRNEDVEVDEWFATVFNKAQEVSERSGGIFDITCAPLINAWGFGFSKMDTITPELIDSLKQFVGYRKVRLEGKKVVKDDPRVILNCSAIAKGYACDVIAALLEREGVKNYLVDIGGESTQKGVNPNGNCWTVGIRKPTKIADTEDAPPLEDTLQLCKKGGIATSGDYQNFYVKNGKKYAHTINPLTGYPAEQDILSSTVIAEDCMTADAYATAFNAMGLNEAVEFAATLTGIEYFFIYFDHEGNYKIKYSPGILQYMPNRKQLAELENP